VTLRVGDKSGTFYVHDVATLQMLKSFGGEEHLLSLLVSLLRPGDTVYDIGAEQGLYTVFCSKAVRDEGRIIAFEPEGSRHERFRGNVRLNRLTNVRVFRLALSDHSSRGTLHRAEIGRAPALSAVDLEEDNAESERVTVVPGDLIVEEKKLPLPAVVKIDVEGHELSVLRGLRYTLSGPLCRVVCCEIHPSLLPIGVQPSDVVNLLRSFGFSRIDTFLRHPDQHVVAYKNQGCGFSPPFKTAP